MPLLPPLMPLMSPLMSPLTPDACSMSASRADAGTGCSMRGDSSAGAPPPLSDATESAAAAALTADDEGGGRPPPAPAAPPGWLARRDTAMGAGTLAVAAVGAKPAPDGDPDRSVLACPSTALPLLLSGRAALPGVLLPDRPGVPLPARASSAVEDDRPPAPDDLRRAALFAFTNSASIFDVSESTLPTGGFRGFTSTVAMKLT